MHHFGVTQYPHGYRMMYLYRTTTRTGMTMTTRISGRGRRTMIEVVMFVAIATNPTRVNTKTRYILSLC